MSDRNRNEFDFDDDFFGNDDDNAPLPGDDEFPSGFGDEQGDMPVMDTEPEEQSGGNRTFLILAGLMILLFLVGLGLVLFLALRDTGPTPAQQTATAISLTNVAIAEFANETATAAAGILFATQTAEAYTDTPSPSPSPTTEPTVTPTPTLDATVLAATQFIEATQTALAGAALSAQETATAIAQQSTLNAQSTEAALTAQANVGTPIAQGPTNTPAAPPPLSAINQTATAIAAQFLTATAAADAGSAEATPTQDGFAPVVRPTALPQTGLFDDVVGGGRDGVGLLALAVVGLVGVIVIARRLRSTDPGDEQKPQ
jgi:hypothetical protein